MRVYFSESAFLHAKQAIIGAHATHYLMVGSVNVVIESLARAGIRLTQITPWILEDAAVPGSGTVCCYATSCILLAKSPTGRRRRKRFAVFVINSDGLFDDLAKLIKHRLFVGAVATAIDKAGRTADVALVLFGPLNDLCVTRAFLHDSVARYGLLPTSNAYLPTGTFSVRLTISIGWKAGSCEPLEDSASTRSRNEAGPFKGA